MNAIVVVALIFLYVFVAVFLWKAWEAFESDKDSYYKMMMFYCLCIILMTYGAIIATIY